MSLIHDDFMLKNEWSRLLYHKYGADMPIFDYHSHLEPEELLKNANYSNLTEIWLKQDHYKWRLMRAAGIPEQSITGSEDDYKKFLAWSGVIEKCIGNPIYHWTHLELYRYFGIREILNPKTAPLIWEQTCSLLKEKDYRPASLLKRARVQGICTTDDPTNALDLHQRIRQEEEWEVQVIPTFRPDRAFSLRGKEYQNWLEKLERISGITIESYDCLEEALTHRFLHFRQAGCLSGDQSITVPDFFCRDRRIAVSAFEKLRGGNEISYQESLAYQTELMLFLAALYHDHNMVMQLHFGAARNVSNLLFERLGPDCGGDTMGDPVDIHRIAPLFRILESWGKLPRTILFSSNPNDYEKLAAFANCFSSDGIPGKIQLGAAWWFGDHKDGIESQLKIIARQSVLPCFVGMLTDSRSILSQSRHDYFRRILCNLLGSWAEAGEIPMDEELLGGFVRDISYRNAAEFFNFKELEQGAGVSYGRK